MARHRPPPGDDISDDSDDAALFRSAIGPVRELPPAALPPSRPRPRPGTRMADLDEAEAKGEFLRLLHEAPVEAGDTLRHRRDDVPARVLKRLAQGDYAAQDELDLHHASAAAAGSLLRRFLQDARDAGAHCVRVIHGKGLNSDGVPVLKNLCDRLLRQRGDVLAFHSAPAAQGGTGAVLVLLAPRRG
ncbi:Smr/MutS family protein [Luteimonas sp. M1R5S18]|uniref:Smr/MutS family protein n=1 Tax=Luteimonas rhizosphaericola TaxID=3042024 RepID=A0ABT6JGI3_9GAMM|nr:Smr/MutS family protein [Luteimonas rhizosphaericola]MDH5829543.1 Smr/MutS family protein [Luteimonas rhizosphaericola]